VDALADRLLNGGEVPEGSVLVPTGDLELEALSRHREALARRYRLCVPSWSATRVLLRKNETARVAGELGIPTPQNHGPPEGLDGRDLRYPVVLKPNDSAAFQRHFGRKLFVAQSPQEFRAFAERIGSAGVGSQVQDLIPGPDSLSFNDTAYYDRQGRRVAGLAIRKLRKSPPFFGIGRVVERSGDPEVDRRMREHVDDFVRRAAWHGPVSAEFKLDPRDGRLVLIEVNGRCSFVHQLAWRCGLDYAWMQFQESCERQPESGPPREGRASLIHLHADLLNALFFRRVERLPLADLVRPYRGRRHFAVWSLGDPWPFFVEWLRTARDVPGLLTSRSARAELTGRAVTIREPCHSSGTRA
jgi:predicted ATP-grasp superfamily ATP-dependent carboligase